MKRNLRILRLYYYGRIKLAKRMKKYAMKEYCKSIIKNIELLKPPDIKFYYNISHELHKERQSFIEIMQKINQP